MCVCGCGPVVVCFGTVLREVGTGGDLAGVPLSQAARRQAEKEAAMAKMARQQEDKLAERERQYRDFILRQLQVGAPLPPSS